MGTSESPIIMPSSHFAFILGLVAITTCLATNEHDQDALGAQYEKLYDLQAEHKDHEMQIIQIKTQMSKIKEKLSTGTLLATKNRQEDLIGESTGGTRRRRVVPRCTAGYTLEEHKSEPNHGDVCRGPGSAWLPPTGCDAQGSAPWSSMAGQSSTPCRVATNKAKCACPSSGTCNNNQEVLVGTHNCEVDLRGYLVNSGQQGGNLCPDDLSMGKFFKASGSNSGFGSCHSFDSDFARYGSTEYSTKATAHAGMVSKMKVAHPHNADTRVGVMAAKRIMCSGDPLVCETFKAVNCFRVPSTNGFKFANIREAQATDAELKEFVDQVTANAWDDAGTANAKIKSNWKCTSTDMELVLGWSAAF